MQRVAIYGAGGFAREVAWLAESASVQVACFIDDDPASHGRELNGIPVIGLGGARETFSDAAVVGGVGSPQTRRALMHKAAAAGFGFRTLIHPNVEMSRFVEVGEGTVVCAGNILTTNIRLGAHVQINLDCTVGHDAILDDYATLAPGVHVSGCVVLGKDVYVGTGANIINGSRDRPLVIGDGAVIGAGACVTKSIEPGATAVGVPAKIIKRRDG